MGEFCPTEDVELQSNGIVRNSEGLIIGRICEHGDMQEVAQQLADALENLSGCHVSAPTPGSLWQFSELRPSIENARDALSAWRKFKGE